MLEPTVGRFVTTEAISGIAQTNHVVIVDPDRRGIVVTRYVSWSRYPTLMEHQNQLRSLDPSPVSGVPS